MFVTKKSYDKLNERFHQLETRYSFLENRTYSMGKDIVLLQNVTRELLEAQKVQSSKNEELYTLQCLVENLCKAQSGKKELKDCIYNMYRIQSDLFLRPAGACERNARHVDVDGGEAAGLIRTKEGSYLNCLSTKFRQKGEDKETDWKWSAFQFPVRSTYVLRKIFN